MIDNLEIIALINKFKTAKVLCVGDIMLDRFIAGDVSRISPEAPIPILQVESEVSMLGGAGNVVRNLLTLGATVDFISVIGSDDAGIEISSMLEASNQVYVDLIIDKNRETSIKTRFLSGNQQILRADKETITDIDSKNANKILRKVTNLLPNCGALILSDYGKGVLEKNLLKNLIATAKQHQIPVIIDPKGKDFSCYKGASLITPNRKELELATDLPGKNDAQVTIAARFLRESCQIENILVTRSADGMTLDVNGDAHHFKAEAREVFDVSGAGDTVVAVMACAMSIKSSITIAAKIANIAAGIVVGKFGTEAASALEIISQLSPTHRNNSENKIKMQNEGIKLINEWRKNNFKIGFTNGCFDILHSGHISLLYQAKSASDKLIVAINTDTSVKKVKGKDRPINSEKNRAKIISALEYVDLVLFFNDKTPIQLIKKIKPDVLIKGADYAISDVVGASIVSDYGGSVILAKLEKGHSTSNLISLIKDSL